MKKVDKALGKIAWHDMTEDELMEAADGNLSAYERSDLENLVRHMLLIVGRRAAHIESLTAMAAR